MANGCAVGVGRRLVAERVAEEVDLDPRGDLVAAVGDIVDAEPQARELGMRVEVGASLAPPTGVCAGT